MSGFLSLPNVHGYGWGVDVDFADRELLEGY
jgi:hypothetical protein